MEKYTLAQCKKDMLKMWGWLAKNGNKNKQDFIDSLIVDESRRFSLLDMQCPCCEYDEKNQDSIHIACSLCPIDWTGDGGKCVSDRSPFVCWDDEWSSRRRKMYAKEIYKLALQIKVEEE